MAVEAPPASAAFARPVPRRPVSARNAGRCGREVGLKRVRSGFERRPDTVHGRREACG
ncbi:hypothetical protein Y023_5942 [Burkholderia pseudomallei A79D]|nr:hypothetical protein Y023_5942 [Burkholderia pseudomallei A79D]KGX94552.1 hypothetical protein X997_5818 [Burkholderia pseudomallei A79C]